MPRKPARNLLVAFQIATGHAHDGRDEEALDRKTSLEPKVLTVPHECHGTLSDGSGDGREREKSSPPHPNREGWKKELGKSFSMSERAERIEAAGRILRRVERGGDRKPEGVRFFLRQPVLLRVA